MTAKTCFFFICKSDHKQTGTSSVIVQRWFLSAVVLFLFLLSTLSLEYDENKSIVFRPSGKVSEQIFHFFSVLLFCE